MKKNYVSPQVTVYEMETGEIIAGSPYGPHVPHGHHGYDQDWEYGGHPGHFPGDREPGFRQNGPWEREE